MKVKLQPPSSTELPAFNPILPPAAITQILLLANPHKVDVVSPDCVQGTCRGERERIVPGHHWWCNNGLTFFFSVLGKSAFAVQTNIQPGRQISRWIRWCGPVSSSKHLGEPLMRGTTLLSSDLLLPLDLGRSCPSSLAEARWPLHTSVASLTWIYVRPVVGVSFYLVPSFIAFLSLFDHLHIPVSCTYFLLFQQSVWCRDI